MKAVIGFIRDLLKFHKAKFAAVILFTLVFAALIFPYDDLGDMVTSKISEISAGAWYIQFDKLNLGFAPPGIKAENVVVESFLLPTLNTQSLQISPWIAGALAGKAGAQISASGLFKGDVSIDFKEGDKQKSGEREKKIVIKAEHVALPQLAEFLRSGNIMNLALQGTLGADTNISIDPLFDRQPTGHIGMKVAGLVLPSQALNTQMGPVQTPTLNLGQLSVQAKMGEGRIELEDLSFGGPNEDLTGKVRGDLSMAFRRDVAGVRPQMGAYDLKVDLSVKKNFLEASSKSGAGLIFVFINKFRQETPQGARFAFRMKAPNSFTPPEFLPLQ